jgi:hypothetical protein
MDNQALVPDTPIIEVEPEEQEDIEVAQALAQDKDTLAVLMSPGWDKLVTKLDSHIENFRTGKFMGDLAGLPLAEVGQKFVIASTIAGICEELKNSVINAATGVIEDGRTGD